MGDVFGPNKGTHHQLCDALAAGGHYVIMPDFFNGGSIEPYYASKQVPKGVEWLKEFDWKHCSTVLDAVHAHLKDEGIERTGSIGFCWGSWVVAKMPQSAKLASGLIHRSSSARICTREKRSKS